MYGHRVAPPSSMARPESSSRDRLVIVAIRASIPCFLTQQEADRRRAARESVFLPATLFSVERVVDSQIKNASVSGLMGEADVELHIRQHVHFYLNRASFHGGLAQWTSGRRFGVSLANALALVTGQAKTWQEDDGVYAARAVRVALDVSAHLIWVNRRGKRRFTIFQRPKCCSKAAPTCARASSCLSQPKTGAVLRAGCNGPMAAKPGTNWKLRSPTKCLKGTNTAVRNFRSAQRRLPSSKTTEPSGLRRSKNVAESASVARGKLRAKRKSSRRSLIEMN